MPQFSLTVRSSPAVGLLAATSILNRVAAFVCGAISRESATRVPELVRSRPVMTLTSSGRSHFIGQQPADSISEKFFFQVFPQRVSINNRICGVDDDGQNYAAVEV
jgi:hypothetical protein